MSIWSDVCKVFKCCIKTAAQIDEALDEDSSNTTVEITNNVQYDPTLLVDKSALAKTPNAAISITIGNVTVAQGARFSLNTNDEEQMKAVSREEKDTAIERLEVDRAKLLWKIAMLNAKNHLIEIPLSDVKATPESARKIPIEGDKVNYFYLASQDSSEDNEIVQTAGDIPETPSDDF